MEERFIGVTETEPDGKAVWTLLLPLRVVYRFRPFDSVHLGDPRLSEEDLHYFEYEHSVICFLGRTKLSCDCCGAGTVETPGDK